MTLFESRFWSKVRITEAADCWLWIAARHIKGYGAVKYNKRMWKAHRVAWELVNGPIPESMLVLHHCDNPPCVNPKHLWLGTQQDNVADRDAKGRQASGDRSGSRLHPESRPRGETHYTKLHPEKVIRGDEHYARRRPDLLAWGDKNGSRKHPERLRPRRGVDNEQSKLTEAQVREIREASEAQHIIAKRFGISQMHVSRIKARTRWGHLK